MCRKYLFLILSFMLILVWNGFVFSQDPGIRDTARIECAENVQPDTQVLLNVYIFNDEPLGGFAIPLAFPNTVDNLDITCDSVSFVGTRAESSYMKTDSLSIDNVNNRLVIWAGWFPGELAPGNGPVARIYFHTGPAWDTTRFFPVDTLLWPPLTALEFSILPGYAIFPAFVKGCLSSAPFLYGDVNCDRQLDVADIFYLINYLFKGGATPTPLLAGDCNCDGEVTVSDVIYLINYVAKSGPPPSC